MFKDIKLYREHIRSDWHKYNLKLKMKNEKTLTEDEYKENMLMEDFIDKNY